MSDVAEKAAEVAAEVVEESVDGVVEVMEVVRNNPAALAVVGFAGLAVGGVAGYLVARQRLKSFYADLASDEIAEAKRFYAGVFKTDEEGAQLTPQDVLAQRHGEAAVEAVRSYRGQDVKSEVDDQDEAQLAKVIEHVEIHSISVDPEPGPHGGTIEVVEKTETHNVFVDPTFDLEEEMKHRKPDEPYVIHHDEFFAGERNYDTLDLTYYEEDDVLVGEGDVPLNVNDTIGDDQLVRFGHGSKDPNMLYVRNEKKEIDYSVTKSSGSYVNEVLGLGPEPGSLKHSEQRQRRRDFRHGEG